MVVRAFAFFLRVAFLAFRCRNALPGLLDAIASM
jgi:hypothetical protein